MNQIPLLIELIGEPGTGKTHAGLLFPNPLLVDCTEQGEGKIIAMKVFPGEWEKRYVHVTGWHDLLNVAEGYSTYVFDTSKDVVGLIGEKWCAKYNKKRVYPPVAYGEVYNMVDRFIKNILYRPANVVMTSTLRDEYVNDKKTGVRERDGYKRLSFESWIRLYVKIKDNKRVYKVIKNRFVDRTSDDFVQEIDGSEFSFDKLVEITFDKVGFDRGLVVM